MSPDIKNNILIHSIEHSNLAHTISRIDGDMELIYVNQAFLDQTGYDREEVLERNCRFLQGDGTDQETVKKIRSAITNRKPLEVEILNYKKDGTPFWNHLRMSPVYDEGGQPIAFIGIQSDITLIHEQNRVENERQKLEALGRLTGNVSHEIKNALQPVKLMAETLSDWQSLDEIQIQRCISILNENVLLADRITQDVLSFSRQSSEEFECINTGELKDDIIRFTKNLLHSRVEFAEVIQNNPFDTDLYVEIRCSQLHQVLMNLVNNAMHAMNDKGTLTLHWCYERIDSTKALGLGIKNGEYLCIGIEDNGRGMNKKTMASALDPFFSTKAPGEGTGLGLSISHKIIAGWNGTITIDSAEGKGTIFKLYIPVK